MNAEYWIEKLDLIPHPEGGFYKEVYRSSENIDHKALPNRYSDDRSFSTSIYYLLKNDQVSKLHRIQSDEVWHHYDGDDLDLFVISKQQTLQRHKLGKSIPTAVPQTIIPHNCWFGARCANPLGYALLGCTVSPGFDFGDFELYNPNRHASEINKLQSEILFLL